MLPGPPAVPPEEHWELRGWNSCFLLLFPSEDAADFYLLLKSSECGKQTPELWEAGSVLSPAMASRNVLISHQFIQLLVGPLCAFSLCPGISKFNFVW